VDPAALLRAAERDGHRLLAVAATDWVRPLPHCPAWGAQELVRHTGGILSWMSAVVESNQRVSRRALDRAPENPVDLPAWYLAALDRTVDVLGWANDYLFVDGYRKVLSEFRSGRFSNLAAVFPRSNSDLPRRSASALPPRPTSSEVRRALRFTNRPRDTSAAAGNTSKRSGDNEGTSPLC